MLYARMHCGNCGNKFDIYSREMNRRGDPVRCPHCLIQMDMQQWEDLITVFQLAEGWNIESEKNEREHATPFFRMELRSKHVPIKKILENLEMEV